MITIEEKIAVYRQLWAELNSLNALIEDLERKRDQVKAKQRQLANGIAAQYAAERERETDGGN